MLEFAFKQSSCVAVGTFNIYILQPKLLAAMGVFELENPILVSGDLTQPGIRFEAVNSVWIVRPDRLSVESKAPNVDCGELVERTLAALCWTPIMGVGINVIFTASGNEELLPDSLRLPSYPNAKQRTVHVAIPHDGDSTLNVQLAQSDDKLELSLNGHTDLSKIKENPQEANRAARSLCASFIEYRRSAVRIAQELLNAEFIYDK